MVIMGLDPGTARVGWGVIKEEGAKLSAVSFGVIETKKDTPSDRRLLQIHTAILKLLKMYHPDAVAIEELFFATNAKTAIAVGQARGVLLLSCAQGHFPTYSYTPLTVKRTVTGDGKADKKQVQYMVRLQLKLKAVPQPDDVADALAIAMTHAYSYRLKHRV